MRFVILINCILFSLAAFASEEFTIYRVQHRTPEELIRVASSMFQGRAAFSSMGEKIVINASPQATRAALDLFKELDQKPRTFRISLRRGGRSQESDQSIGTEVDLRKKNLSLQKRSGVGQGKENGRVQVGGVGVVVGAGEANSRSGESSTIQVLEGSEAQLSTGNSFFPSGMWVRPRPLGNGKVQLELYSRKSKGVNAESASTTMQAPLGKWTSVGGVDKQSSGTRGEMLGKGESSAQSTNDLNVLVEEIR
jgi:hypothetical protein